MLTTKQVTYILLEKGFEDELLLIELRKLISKSTIEGIAKQLRSYPMVMNLIHRLTGEVAEEV